MPTGQAVKQVFEYVPFTGSWSSGVYNLTLAYAPSKEIPFLHAYVVDVGTGDQTIIDNSISYLTAADGGNTTKLQTLAGLWWTGSTGATLYVQQQGLIVGGRLYVLAVSYLVP